MIKAASIKRVSREIERGIKKHKAAVTKGMVRGLNRSIITVRKIAVEEVQGTLNVKAGAAKKSFVVERANNQNLRMSIGAKYKRLGLSAFVGTRKTKKGVSVQPRNDKPRKLFKGAFIATMPSGHKGVFWRSKSATHRTKGRPKTSSPNLKIRELYGTPLRTVFSDKTEAVQRKADPVIDKSIEREIKYALSQSKEK